MVEKYLLAQTIAEAHDTLSVDNQTKVVITGGTNLRLAGGHVSPRRFGLSRPRLT